MWLRCDAVSNSTSQEFGGLEPYDRQNITDTARIETRSEEKKRKSHTYIQGQSNLENVNTSKVQCQAGGVAQMESGPLTFPLWMCDISTIWSIDAVKLQLW